MCGKFQVVQIFSQLQKPVRAIWNVGLCKIINLKLFFVNIVILIVPEIVIVCFNITGNK